MHYLPSTARATNRGMRRLLIVLRDKSGWAVLPAGLRVVTSNYACKVVKVAEIGRHIEVR